MTFDRPEVLHVLARNLHGARLVFGWSIKLAAERAGIAAGTWKSIEALRGNPGASTLFRLANALGLTFSSLLDADLLEHLPPQPSGVTRYVDPDALSAGLGSKIAALRYRRGLSRIKLAEISGLSRSALLLIESSRTETNLTNLERIAEALKIPLAKLVEGRDSPIVAAGSRGQVLGPLQQSGIAELVSDSGGGIGIQCFELALRRSQRVSFPADDVSARALLYVLAGRVRLIGATGEHNLHPDDVVIVARDAPLIVANWGSDPVRVVFVAATPPRWDDVGADDETP